MSRCQIGRPISQLSFAIWMAREVRGVLRSCTICVDGTEISDVLKCASRGGS
jgi:hypothetical protein